ncbi:MAG: serine/threonine-protein kinase [Polyangiales bacterium]
MFNDEVTTLKRLEPRRAPSVDHRPALVLPRVGDVIDARYRIDAILGVGGMGVVVAARDLRERRDVAVKLLRSDLLAAPETRDEDLARFVREGRAARALASKHVVRVLDAACTDSREPYLVFERLQGHDLSALRPRFTCEAAVDLVLQACDAVAEAHTLGIVHRDLKPANLFLTHEGEDARPVLKVLDFGVSKRVDDGEAPLVITGANVVLGTPYYMAPEVLRGAREATPRSDIWALGAILFELLAGEPPGGWRSYDELVARLFTRPAPPLRAHRPDAPAGLASIIAEALARDAAARPPSVVAFARALRPFASARGRATCDEIVETVQDALERRSFSSWRPSSDSSSEITATMDLAKSAPPPPRMRAAVLVMLAGAAMAIGAAVGGVAADRSRLSESLERPTDEAEVASLSAWLLRVTTEARPHARAHPAPSGSANRVHSLAVDGVRVP